MTTMMETVRMDQTKSGIFQNVMPGRRSLKIVTRKLIPPRIDDVPTTTSPKSHKSTPGPSVYRMFVSGAYPVQPTSACPIQIIAAAGGSIQNPSALIRGNAISFAPMRMGTK